MQWKYTVAIEENVSFCYGSRSSDAIGRYAFTLFLLLLCCFCAFSSAEASALRLAPAPAGPGPAVPEGAGDALEPWFLLKLCCD